MSNVVCFAVFLMNILRPEYFPVGCQLRTLPVVLCEKKHNNKSNFNSKHQIHHAIRNDNTLRCAGGMYVSKQFICDGNQDCQPTADDEEHCSCTVNKMVSFNSTFCQKYCHPHNCKCPALYQQLTVGGCVKYNDNHLVFSQPGSKIHSCDDKSLLSSKLFNDLIPDCTSGEDELDFESINVTKTQIFEKKNMHECYSGSNHFYKENERCQYKLDRETKALRHCRNGEHLQNCTRAECSQNKLKCPNSYCIQYSYVCDGKWDCWNGADEINCNEWHCNELFKCRSSTQCVHLKDLCDHKVDCPYQDDELDCQNIICLSGCDCLSKAVSCRDLKYDFFPLPLNNFSFIQISHSRLPTEKTRRVMNVAVLFLINNSVTDLNSILDIWQLDNLVMFNVSFNEITHMKPKSEEVATKGLKTLVLSNNHLSNISFGAFTMFPNLTTLDISSNNISILKIHVFSNLLFLKVIVLHGNFLTRIHKRFMLDSFVQLIFTDNHHVCCAVKENSDTICTAKFQWFSPCKRMLETDKGLKATLWLLSALLLFCNTISGLLNLHMLLKKGKAKSVKRHKTVFHFLSFSCGVSDVSVGLYILLASTHIWRFSDYVSIEQGVNKMTYCHFLGSIGLWAFISSNILTNLVSGVRYFAIKHPLKASLTADRVTFMVSVVFGVSGLMSLGKVFARLNVHLEHTNCFPLGSITGSTGEIVSVSIFAMFLTLSCTITTFAYMKLLSAMHSSSKQVLFHSTSQRDVSQDLKRYVFLTSFAHLTCLLPSAILYCSSLVPSHQSKNLQDTAQLFILPLNSLFNPLVFNLQTVRRKHRKKERK